ncbi:MAG TPA: tetratricopeptide repeat protein [Terriglobales bacterium]|nr:tetratricopeptide repeat protein [Terriglobales bacterium]
MLRNLPAIVIGAALAVLPAAQAKDLRIKIPKRSDPTPVQKLNQEGVKEIQKHHLEKAQRIFYKAYLLDPDDPFTLNNLGYISELQGKVERAQRYYELAAKENNSETVIAEATEHKLQGKKLSQVTGSYSSLDLRVNRGNIQAMALLQQGRAQEAEDVLRNTLKLQPNNPFTLNNLGYTMEMQGNLEQALQYYNQASIAHSTEPIVVSVDPRWRGKPISDIAFRNEEAVRQRLQSEGSQQAKAARLNLEGVSALNHNQQDKAEQYFREAYQLDPQNAFSLNNMGFVSEILGDQETAADFYDRARRGDQAGTAVSAASRHEMVGEAVGQVAASNTQAADAGLQAIAEAKRRKHEPIVLRRRDNTPVPKGQPDSVPQSENPNVPRPPLDNAPVENNVPRPPQ